MAKRAIRAPKKVAKKAVRRGAKKAVRRRPGGAARIRALAAPARPVPPVRPARPVPPAPPARPAGRFRRGMQAVGRGIVTPVIGTRNFLRNRRIGYHEWRAHRARLGLAANPQRTAQAKMDKAASITGVFNAFHDRDIRVLEERRKVFEAREKAHKEKARLLKKRWRIP